MKIFLLFCGFLLIAVFILGSFQLTRVCEIALSLSLKQDVHIEDAHWQSLKEIELKGIWIGKAPMAIQIKEGELKINAWAPPTALISLKQVQIPVKLLDRFRILGSVLHASLDKAVLIPELSFAIHIKPEKVVAQLYRSNLPNVWVRGGVAFDGERLRKLNALILFSDPKILNRIPKSMQGRLVKRSPNFLGSKIIYAANRIRMQGARGPLLEAEWAF